MGLQPAARGHICNLCLCYKKLHRNVSSYVYIYSFLFRATREPTHSHGCGSLTKKKSLDSHALNSLPSPHFSVLRLLNLGFAFPFFFEFSAFLGINDFLIIHTLSSKFDKFPCWENNCLCNLVFKKPCLLLCILFFVTE